DNMFKVMKGIRSMLEASTAVKPEEHVLVIADNDGGSTWIGQLVANVATEMGAEAVLAVINPRDIIGQEPPTSVAVAMKSVNAIFRITESAALVHGDARKEATAAGARYYIMNPELAGDLEKGVSAEDLLVIKERTESVAQRLTEASIANITNPSGTKITMSLAGREGIALNPMSQIVANFPDYAEAAIAPVEGTAEGIIIADLAIVQWKYLLREPLRLTVKAGKVVDISGCTQDADRLRKIAATDENAANIAELGIGTSHTIPWEMHGTRRDAARIGTAHIAIGRSNDIGGETWSRIHYDCLMSQATVELDGEYLLMEGTLLI
ncbi:aminopeptidase, partial [Chloroflexota bacterium]